MSLDLAADKSVAQFMADYKRIGAIRKPIPRAVVYIPPKRPKRSFQPPPPAPLVPEIKCTGDLFSNILIATANHYKVSVDRILSRQRDPRLIKPRQVICHLAKKLTATAPGRNELAMGMSSVRIGERMGRDHSTVLWYLKKVSRNLELQAAADAIAARLKT